MDQLRVGRATHEEIAQIHLLRREVFVQEQGVPPELEVDELDDEAVHAASWMGERLVGTGRLVWLHGPETSAEAHIGRMAVLSGLRRRGIGSRLLRFLEEEARRAGADAVALHAQSYVAEFYRVHGYWEEGDRFLEAGIQHVLMRKTLGSM